MRNPKESDLESRVTSDAKAMGVLSTKLGVRSDVAWPDRAFWIPGGRPLIGEFKLEGEEPRKNQKHKISILERLGYDVLVINNYDRAMRVMQGQVAQWLKSNLE